MVSLAAVIDRDAKEGMEKPANWSKPLPKTIVIPSVMTLRTLADVRELMRHLPEDRRARPTWRHVAAQLNEAVGSGDTEDVAIALRLALMLEGVECRPK